MIEIDWIKGWWDSNGDATIVDKFEPDGYDMHHIEITPNILYENIVGRLKREYILTPRTPESMDGD